MSAAPFGVGAALTWTEQQLTGFVSQSTTFPVMATSPTSILTSNADRVELIIFNLDVVDAFVLNSSSVSTTQGFKINANGGFLIFKLKDDFTFLTEAFWGVSSSGTAKLTVTEIFRITNQPYRKL